MRKWGLILLFIVAGSFFFSTVNAQCSICARTAQQLGEKPGKALNAGILYLAFAPLAIFGYIGYRWWKSDHDA